MEWFYCESALVPKLPTIYRSPPHNPPKSKTPTGPLVIAWRPAEGENIMQALRAIRFFDELARVFNNPEQADFLLTMADIPTDRLPAFFGQTPIQYWTAVGTALDQGLVPDALGRLVRAARAEYPGNEPFALAAGLFEAI